MANWKWAAKRKPTAKWKPVMTREFCLIAMFLITFPVVAYVSTLPPQRFHNEITQWGDRSSKAYADFTDYRQKFGANELVVLSWPGCDLEDPRLEEVTSKIESQLGDRVQQVSNGLRVLSQLKRGANLSHSAAVKRLRNVFLSQTGFATGVGFQIDRSQRLRRGEIIESLDSILRSSNVDPQAAMFAGLGHNLYSLDKEGLESPFRMVPQIMLAAFVLTLFFVRNFWLAVFINAVGTYTGCLSFNVIYLAGVDMNAIIWPLPTLTMLLTVSAAIHFLSYFKQAVETTAAPSADFSEAGLRYRRAVAKKTFGQAFKPMVCCTGTTTIGLSSLLLSSSEPVRQFGFFGAISISLAGGLLLLWFPACLTLIGFADQYAEKKVNRHGAEKSYNDLRQSAQWQGDVWSGLAAFTLKFRWPVVVACTALLIVCGVGVSKVKTGSRLQNFFPVGHRVLKEATTIESHVGPLASIELLLHFADVDPANDQNRMRAIQRLSSRVVSLTDIQSCLSGATFAPRLKRGKQTALQYAATNKRLQRLKEVIVDAGLLHRAADNSVETWRVSCRYGINTPLDIGITSQRLVEIAEDVFKSEGRSILAGEEFSVSTTGEFVLFDQIDQQFFAELMFTYATAFGVIAVVVMVVVRDLRTAVIAMLPNLFPAVVVLGSAGYLTQSLDVASLMTASVALGIAVDDTLHFLLLGAQGSRSPSASEGQAVVFSQPYLMEHRMRYCGRAMVQTSVILGASIVLYAFCGFLPTVRFGILLSSMMFAALIGDLIYLPSLLNCFAKQTEWPEQVRK